MENEKKSILEDYGSKPVPKDQQKGWFGVGIVYWGVAVCLPAFLLSGMIAGPMRLGSAIGIFLLGSVVLGGIAILMGIIGSQTKMSTGLSAKYTFGKYGAFIFQITIFFAFWGWFGVQLGFMAAGLGDGGLAMVLGGRVPIWFLKIIGGILMTATAMFGFKAIEKLTIVAIPLLLIIMFATIISIYGGGKSLSDVARITAEGALPFGVAVSILIGSFIAGGIAAPDITRYAKNKSSAGFGMAFGMIIGFPIVLILASIMVKGAGGELDFSKVMINNNAGFWKILAVVTIILAAWTTNDNNLYSGALSINAMFPRLKKWTITVISGSIGTLLAILGINTAGGFQTFLSILAVLIPPAAAIMIVDYYIFRNKENNTYSGEDIEKVSTFRLIPFSCWMIGSGFGFILQYTSLRLTGITAIDTILLGAVLYFIVNKIVKKSRTLPS